MIKKHKYHLERELDSETVGYWAIIGPGIHEKVEDQFLAKKIVAWLNGAYELGYLTKFKEEQNDKTI